MPDFINELQKKGPNSGSANDVASRIISSLNGVERALVLNTKTLDAAHKSRGGHSSGGNKGYDDTNIINQAARTQNLMMKNLESYSKSFTKKLTDDILLPLKKLPKVGEQLYSTLGKSLQQNMLKQLNSAFQLITKDSRGLSKEMVSNIVIFKSATKQMTEGLKQMLNFPKIQKAIETKYYQTYWKTYFDNNWKKTILNKVAIPYIIISERIKESVGTLQKKFHSAMDNKFVRWTSEKWAAFQNTKFYQGARQFAGGGAQLLGGLGSILGKLGPIFSKGVGILGGAIASGTVLLTVAALAAALIPVAAAVAAIGGAFVLAWKNALEFQQNVINVRKELGVTYQQAKQLQNVITGVSDRFLSFGISLEKVSENAKSLVGEFGNLNFMMGKQGSKNLDIITRLTEAYGVGSSEAAKMIVGLEQMYGMTADQVYQFMKNTQSMASSAGVSFGAIISDVASDMSLIVRSGKMNVDNLTKAAIKARQMGISIASIGKIQDTFEDLDNVLEKSATLQFLTGKAYNPFEIYSAAQFGDFEKLQDLAIDATKQFVSMHGELKAMPLSVKKQFSDIFGLTLEEMAKIEQYAKMTPMELAKSRDASKEWENSLSTITGLWDKLKGIGQSLLTKVLRPISNSMSGGLENMNTLLSNLQNKLIKPGGIADRLENVVKKMVIGVGKIFGFGEKAKSKNIFEILISGAESALSWITDKVEDYFVKIDEKGQTGFDRLINKAKSFYDEGIKPVVDAFLKMIDPASYGNGLSFWTNIQNNMSNLLTKTIESLEGPFTDLLSLGISGALGSTRFGKLMGIDDIDTAKKNIGLRKQVRGIRGMENQISSITGLESGMGPLTKEQMGLIGNKQNLINEQAQQILMANRYGRENGLFGSNESISPSEWEKKRSGGYISGLGSPIGDTVPALLSSGEFVVNSQGASGNRSMLEAMNKNKFAGGTPGKGADNIFSSIWKILAEGFNNLMTAWKITFGKEGRQSLFVLLKEGLGTQDSNPYLKQISSYFDSSLFSYKSDIIAMHEMTKANGAMKTMQSGGLLNGPSHGSGGIKATVGGKGMVELEGGEGVINKRSMRNPKLRNLASMINVIGGGRSFATGGITSRFDDGGLVTLAESIKNYEGWFEGSRSYRNNNPGNIEFGDFAKQFGSTSGDPRFAKFPSYESGWNALLALIRKYSSSGNTLESMMHKYAPANENNTKAYIENLASKLGVTPGTLLSNIISGAQGITSTNSGGNMSMSKSRASVGFLPMMANGGYIPNDILMMRLGMGMGMGSGITDTNSNISVDMSKVGSQDKLSEVQPNVQNAWGIINNKFPGSYISTAVKGHNKMVKGGKNVSEHFYGRAIDIGAEHARGHTSGDPAPRGVLDDVANFVADRWGLGRGNKDWSGITQGDPHGQLIWRSNSGGNHFNHVHLSVRDGAKFGDGGEIPSFISEAGHVGHQMHEGLNLIEGLHLGHHHLGNAKLIQKLASMKGIDKIGKLFSKTLPKAGKFAKVLGPTMYGAMALLNFIDATKNSGSFDRTTGKRSYDRTTSGFKNIFRGLLSTVAPGVGLGNAILGQGILHKDIFDVLQENTLDPLNSVFEKTAYSQEDKHENNWNNNLSNRSVNWNNLGQGRLKTWGKTPKQVHTSKYGKFGPTMLMSEGEAGGIVYAKDGMSAVIKQPTYMNIGGQSVIAGESGPETLSITPGKPGGTNEIANQLRNIEMLLKNIKFKVLIDGQENTKHVVKTIIENSLLD